MKNNRNPFGASYEAKGSRFNPLLRQGRSIASEYLGGDDLKKAHDYYADTQLEHQDQSGLIRLLSSIIKRDVNVLKLFDHVRRAVLISLTGSASRQRRCEINHVIRESLEACGAEEGQNSAVGQLDFAPPYLNKMWRNWEAHGTQGLRCSKGGKCKRSISLLCTPHCTTNMSTRLQRQSKRLTLPEILLEYQVDWMTGLGLVPWTPERLAFEHSNSLTYLSSIDPAIHELLTNMFLAMVLKVHAKRRITDDWMAETGCHWQQEWSFASDWDRYE